MGNRLSVLLVLFLLLPTSGAQELQGVSAVFLGASNTNTRQWNNGSYVTKIPEYGFPWSDITINNSGVDGVGAVSYYLQDDLLRARLLDYSTDIILVMLGGNDVLQFQTVSEFTRNFSWLIGTITNHTSALVFISNIIWSPVLPLFPENIINRYIQFQEIILNTSKTFNHHFIDVFNATEGRTEYYQNDFIHLNEVGHKTLAKIIFNQTRQTILDNFSDRIVEPITNRMAAVVLFATISTVLLGLSYFAIKKLRSKS